MDLVTDGPSRDVSQQAAIVELEDGRVGVDDVLTADELDVLCGTYHVYTGTYPTLSTWPADTNIGTLGSGEQLENVSWWPPHARWGTVRSRKGGRRCGHFGRIMKPTVDPR